MSINGLTRICGCYKYDIPTDYNLLAYGIIKVISFRFLTDSKEHILVASSILFSSHLCKDVDISNVSKNFEVLNTWFLTGPQFFWYFIIQNPDNAPVQHVTSPFCFFRPKYLGIDFSVKRQQIMFSMVRFCHSATPFYCGVQEAVSCLLMPYDSQNMLNGIEVNYPPLSLLRHLMLILISFSTELLKILNTSKLSFL